MTKNSKKSMKIQKLKNQNQKAPKIFLQQVFKLKAFLSESEYFFIKIFIFM